MMDYMNRYNHKPMVKSEIMNVLEGNSETFNLGLVIFILYIATYALVY